MAMSISSLFLMDLLLTVGGLIAADDVPSSASRRQDIEVAIEEMQRANHFTYVMLINMAPPHLIPPGNLTFLMPNDKALSKNNMIIPPDENSVADFLLRHSIPSPLLMEHLQHFPTGSIIPTSKPDLVLKITNQGRRSFFLNNVRIISPNICTRGSSIRCHGIDGVIQDFMLSTTPSPDCRNNTSTGGGSHPPQAAPPPPSIGYNTPTPTEDNSSTSSTAAVAPAGTGRGGDSNKSSAAPHQISSNIFGVSNEFVTACAMLLVSTVNVMHY